jgi:hypothetical protein
MNWSFHPLRIFLHCLHPWDLWGQQLSGYIIRRYFGYLNSFLMFHYLFRINYIYSAPDISFQFLSLSSLRTCHWPKEKSIFAVSFPRVLLISKLFIQIKNKHVTPDLFFVCWVVGIGLEEGKVAHHSSRHMETRYALHPISILICKRRDEAARE